MKPQTEISKVWFDVPGTEGVYQANTNGEVRNSKRNYILTPNQTKTGYYDLKLYISGVKRSILLHRIIASTIKDPTLPIVQERGHINKLREVNHINSDKSDNRASNIEIIDYKHNLRLGHKNRDNEKLTQRNRANAKKRIQTARNRSKIPQEDIFHIRQEYLTTDITLRELADRYQVSESYMSNLIKGEVRI